MKHLKKWIRLLTTSGLGIKLSLRIIELLGDPSGYVGIKNSPLNDLSFISQHIKDDLSKDLDPPNWGRIKKIMESKDIKYLTILDEEYPSLLKSIFEPPLILFYRGNFNSEKIRRSFAVVGTRKCTFYGKEQTKKIVEGLCKSGVSIVSGLALGIDTIAHHTAVNHYGYTVVVLGSGVDYIYPPENRKLADEILKNGILISEFLPGSKIERWNFPRRNRIISGLSLGTLVVEGNIKSGAMLTSKFALEQNREIFALPGDINKKQAEGPNYLIKLGAKLTESANDILETLNIKISEEIEPTFFPELTTSEEEIYQIILNNKPSISIDNLIIKSNKLFSELSSIILQLELKNIIKRLPGNKIAPLF
jgi:DNA processing protein